MTRGIQLVIAITAVLGCLVVALSLYYFFAASSVTKDTFQSVVTQTLLPIFNTLVTATLAWIFGKPIVAALARRIALETKDGRDPLQ